MSINGKKEGVPSADSADNTYMQSVVGNKNDTTSGDSLVSLTKIVDAVVDAIKAKTDNLPSDTDAIMETQPRIVSKATANLPQTTQSALFTVTGRVLITQLVGEVTTVIQTQDNNTKLVANPTVGADVDLCAVLNISADAVGTMYNITGTLTDAMIATTSGAFQAQLAAIVCAAGTIDLYCAASNTGQVKWTLHYIPLDSGSSVA